MRKADRRLDERNLNNFAGVSLFASSKGVSPSGRGGVHFVSLKCEQYICPGTESGREKNVCFNFAFLCVLSRLAPPLGLRALVH